MSRESILIDEGIEKALKKQLDIKEDENEPQIKDKYYMALIIFYVTGTLAALPENFFLTATDYWNYKFRNTTDPDADKTYFQVHFFSLFNSVALTVAVITLLASLKLISFSINKRLLSAMMMMLIAFGTTLTLTRVNTDSWQQSLYVISILTGAFLRAAGVCFLVPISQLAWRFPPKYLAAQVTGRGICGLLSALTQILSLAVTSNSESTGFIYFLIGTIWTVLTLVLYVFTERTSKYFKVVSSRTTPKIEGSEFSKELFKSALLKLWAPVLALCLVMLGSLAVHPGVTSLIQSVNPGTQFADKYFVVVTTYLTVNFFDIIGRELAIRFTINIQPIFLVLIGFIRLIVLVPLILMCNIQPRNNLPVWFENDYTYVILMILFALSEGYFGNVCILILPKMMTPQETKLGVGVIIVFMIVTVALFSYTSILLIKIL